MDARTVVAVSFFLVLISAVPCALAAGAPKTITVQSGPAGIVYDSGAGEIYVVNGIPGTASIISDSSYQVVGSADLGVHSLSAAYDSGKGEVFVTNNLSNNVSVVFDRTGTVVATIPVGSDPFGIAYDPAKGEVFVANFG